ncbi:MAG: AraC family ligand binding domain-containing protein, partial [Treponema sp.]|nr:AraC family ligand binding domain-containing protein [Treponema sp.]
MQYLICENEKPLIHVSSGQLLNEENFKHPRRNLDTWVIIICIKGKLYIAQDNRYYTLTENQYLILFSGHEHFGFKECEKDLSYYWCHFRISENVKYKIMKNDELTQVFDTKDNVLDTFPTGNHISRYCILPEFGDISANGRATLIFRQLLDLARNDHYSDM